MTHAKSARQAVPTAIAQAIAAFRAGRPVIMVDDALRENEGDVVLAAQFATAETVNFMAVHARGLICLALEDDQVQRLDLPMMPRRGHDPRGTAFTVSIEATTGITTGISAADRARTIQLAASRETQPSDISTPGHVFPLRAHPEGCVTRPGHTEGAVDLARLAGLTPAAVICEIINEDGTMARQPELLTFGRAHDLPVLAIEDLVRWCRAHGRDPLYDGTIHPPCAEPPTTVAPVASAALPSAFGGTELYIQAFRSDDGIEHLALVRGDPSQPGCLVRVHSECITGDALGSLRCDCGPQLREALAQIQQAENGLLIYLRGQEGRGIGFGNKIRAYALQDQGVDTFDANVQLGLPVDAREWFAAADMLRFFKAQNITLLTNNPDKTEGLTALGITIEKTQPLVAGLNPFNRHYLTTKQTRMGHQLDTAPENFLRDYKASIDDSTHDS